MRIEVGGEMEYVKFEVYIPEEYLASLREELNKHKLLGVGKYDMVAGWAPVRGSWRPLAGAKPYNGMVGEICTASEVKLEFRCPAAQVEEAKEIIRAIHPYEEPVITVLALL
jgi:hypothetical protein